VGLLEPLCKRLTDIAAEKPALNFRDRLLVRFTIADKRVALAKAAST
jgi:hypothetical protein